MVGVDDQSNENLDPESRTEAVLTITHDYLYVYGGKYCARDHGWRLNLLSQQWVRLEIENWLEPLELEGLSAVRDRLASNSTLATLLVDLTKRLC